MEEKRRNSSKYFAWRTILPVLQKVQNLSMKNGHNTNSISTNNDYYHAVCLPTTAFCDNVLFINCSVSSFIHFSFQLQQFPFERWVSNWQPLLFETSRAHSLSPLPLKLPFAVERITENGRKYISFEERGHCNRFGSYKIDATRLITPNDKNHNSSSAPNSTHLVHSSRSFLSHSVVILELFAKKYK